MSQKRNRTMFQILIKSVIAATALFTLEGCGTQLRAPVCKEGEFEFPEGVSGRYRFSMMGQSTAYSGALADFAEIEFEIVESPEYYDMKLYNLLPEGTSKRFKTAPGFTAVFEDSGSTAPAIKMPLSSCRIGGQYYSQNRSDDSTYALSRLDVSPTGISTTGLGWKPEALKEIGVGFYAFPKLDSVDQDDGEFTFDMVSPVQLIVENQALDDETRARLLTASRASGFSTLFTRIGDKRAKSQRPKKVLRLKRAL